MRAHTIRQILLVFTTSIWVHVTCPPDTCSLVSFNRKHFGKMMEGQKIEVKSVTTFSVCVYDCMMTTYCLSMNFDLDVNMCEMNSENSSTSPESLVDTTKSIRYSDISIWPKSATTECRGVECPSGHRCSRTNSNSVCIKSVVNCGNPKMVPYAYLLPGSSTLGSVRRYRCISGGSTIKMVTKCLANSQWTPTYFECLPEETVRECSKLLLTGSGLVAWTDFWLSASSVYDQGTQNHRAERALLDSVAEPGKSGGWTAKHSNTKQWIKVDLKVPQLVRGVITQGRNDAPEWNYQQWVTEFKVFYSIDCEKWTSVSSANKLEALFQGNWDTDTHVTNYFECPVKARCMRINPTSWHDNDGNSISMRFDVIGCTIGENKKR